MERAHKLDLVINSEVCKTVYLPYDQCLNNLVSLFHDPNADKALLFGTAQNSGAIELHAAQKIPDAWHSHSLRLNATRSMAREMNLKPFVGMIFRRRTTEPSDDQLKEANELSPEGDPFVIAVLTKGTAELSHEAPFSTTHKMCYFNQWKDKYQRVHISRSEPAHSRQIVTPTMNPENISNSAQAQPLETAISTIKRVFSRELSNFSCREISNVWLFELGELKLGFEIHSSMPILPPILRAKNGRVQLDFSYFSEAWSLTSPLEERAKSAIDSIFSSQSQSKGPISVVYGLSRDRFFTTDSENAERAGAKPYLFHGDITKILEQDREQFNSRLRLPELGKGVSIFGCDDVNSRVAEGLVRNGVSYFTLIDTETVGPDFSSPFTCHDVGRPKADALAKRLLKINPAIKVEVIKADVADSSTVKKWLERSDFQSFLGEVLVGPKDRNSRNSVASLLNSHLNKSCGVFSKIRGTSGEIVISSPQTPCANCIECNRESFYPAVACDAGTLATMTTEVILSILHHLPKNQSHSQLPLLAEAVHEKKSVLLQLSRYDLPKCSIATPPTRHGCDICGPGRLSKNIHAESLLESVCRKY